jgi:hypothetical protein
VEAIPDDETARAISFFTRISASNKLIKNVFPVPPGASRKKRPPFSLAMRSVLALYAKLWSFVRRGLLVATKFCNFSAS